MERGGRALQSRQQQELDEEVARLSQQRLQQTPGRTSGIPSMGEPTNVKHSTAARPNYMDADIAPPVSHIRDHTAMQSSVADARSELRYIGEPHRRSVTPAVLDSTLQRMEQMMKEHAVNGGRCRRVTGSWPMNRGRCRRVTESWPMNKGRWCAVLESL